MSRVTSRGVHADRAHGANGAGGAGTCRWRTLVVALLLTATYVTVPASLVAQSGEVVIAQNDSLETRTREVASQLRCPVCQGNSIQDSPSELAQEMKGVVRDQLAAGKSPDEVRQYFVDKYGEWILLEPKASGFNLVVYLLPLVGVLVGGVIIWRAVRKWTTAPASSESDASESVPLEPGTIDRGHTP